MPFSLPTRSGFPDGSLPATSRASEEDNRRSVGASSSLACWLIPPEITRRNATLLILIWRWPLDRVARRYGRGHRGARERSQRDLLATKSAICNFRPDRPVADFHCRLVCRCVSWRHNLPADVHADKLCSGYSESKRPRLEFELSLSRGRQVSVAAAAARCHQSIASYVNEKPTS